MYAPQPRSVKTYHKKANASAAEGRNNRLDLRPQGINDSNETNHRQATLGMLSHLVFELSRTSLVLDVLVRNYLASEKDASLSLAAIHVLDAFHRGSHISIERKDFTGVCCVERNAIDKYIWGTLDGQETRERQSAKVFSPQSIRNLRITRLELIRLSLR